MSRPLFDLSKSVRKGTSPIPSMKTARVVWLQQRKVLDERGEKLLRHMQSQYIGLAVVDAFDVSTAEILGADLVLLDAFDSVEGSVETLVARIRFESRVPLIMLTDGYSTEQLVTALTAGADAIWSLNTPVEVLIARCNALLRNWLPPKR